MTPTECKAEFDRLFQSIPGKNIDRIRKVCSILYCKEHTVRVWRMKATSAHIRFIPESKVRILRDALSKAAA